MQRTIKGKLEKISKIGKTQYKITFPLLIQSSPPKTNTLPQKQNLTVKNTNKFVRDDHVIP